MVRKKTGYSPNSLIGKPICISKKSQSRVLLCRHNQSKNGVIGKVMPTRLGHIEMKVVNHNDETTGKRLSRHFIIKTKDRPTVTIIDNEPNSSNLTGSIHVLGRSFSFSLTQKQINDAYGKALSKELSENEEQ